MDDLELANLEAEVEDTDNDVEEQKPVEDKRPSSVVKLLKQRNELKKENEELKAKLPDTENLTKKMAELEEMVARQALETESKQQKQEFFSKNPMAKEFESQIDELVASKWLTQDEAFKLYAAENNPSLLLDEQYRNKATSTSSLTWVPKDQTIDKSNLTAEDAKDMSPEEFLQWSDWMAKKSRIESWYTN